MENQDYSSVIGNSAAPFINSLSALGSTMSQYHSYGAGAFSGDSIGGCSAACYVAFMGGDTYGVSDGYSCCLGGTTLVDQLQTAGLTWQAYCESGCPRGNDHFPFTGFASDANSPNVYTSSSVSTSDLIAAANGASPANFLWYTPTDNNNMHDNSVSTGDSYLQQFLAGSGTVQNPASGSLLASNVFTNPSFHTMLYLWWDEYDPSPNVEYGSMIKAGYTSTASYDEYSSLRTIEDNWGLSHLANVALASDLTDLFGSSGPSPLSTSVTISLTSVLVNLPATFTATTTGGTQPYTISWTFGDGSSATGATVTHTYNSAQKFTVTETAKDSSSPQQTVTSSNTVTVLASLPLTTSFNVSTNPVVNSPVTFTSTTTGGTGPYTVSWNFGDGSTGSGATVTHSYATPQAYTVTETVTDSSTPQQTATSTLTVDIASSSSGDFGVCTSLPKGWSCGNTNGLSSSSANIVNGVFDAVEINPGVGDDNNYYFSTTQKGTFPWSPCQAPASGVLPTNLSSVTTTFTMTNFVPSGAYRYHIYIALYYWLPNGAVSAGGSTYQCLDTQVRVENINGAFSPVGTTAMYNPGDSFGWDQVTLGSLNTGQTYTLTANIADQCQEDYAAWGIDPSTPCQLAGIEIGIEGYQFQELDVNFDNVQLTTGTTAPPTSSFSFSPTDPQVEQIVSFTGTASAGTPPYSYSWDYGDGSTGTGQSTTHAYTSTGTYTVTLTATDSAGQTATDSKTITVTNPSASALTTSFTYSPLSPLAGETVTFTASASGGTSAYSFLWVLGDGSTGTGSTAAHSYASAGTFTVTLTVKDSGSPQQTSTSQQSVTVSVPPPVLTASSTYSPSSPQVGQSVSFAGSASGGTAPYSYSWSFGDGSTGTGSSVIHPYSSAGSFTVTLTARDSGSSQQTASSQQTVTVSNPSPSLTSGFTFSPSSPQVGQQVTFSGSASGGTSPYSFSWSFGDGSTATGSAVTHGYSSAGSFTVALTVKDSGSPQQTASSQQTITVSSLPTLSASFSYSPSSPQAGQQVTFTASASGGTLPYTFSWSFGDGSNGSGSSVTHTYSLTGTYTPTLTVVDSTAQTATSSMSIIISPSSAADFQITASSPAVVNVGQSSMSTLTITPLNGFSGTVTLTEAVPTGLACSPITPSSVMGSGTVALSCTGSSNGILSVEVLAASGSLAHTITVSFSFADFAIGASHVTITEIVHATGTSTVTISALSGFSSIVSLAVASSDSTVAARLNASTIVGSGTAILLVSGTSVGTFIVTVTGSSGPLQHSLIITVSVQPNHAPTLTLPGPRSTTVGSAIVFVVNATDPDGEAVTLAAASLPSGATFDPATGMFYWLTSSNNVGHYNVTFTATDNGSPSLEVTGFVLMNVQASSTTPPTQQPDQGGCTLCNVLPLAQTSFWILLVGGAVGFLLTIVVMYARARNRLDQKRWMRRFNEE